MLKLSAFIYNSYRAAWNADAV